MQTKPICVDILFKRWFNFSKFVKCRPNKYATLLRCVKASCGLFPWQSEHFQKTLRTQGNLCVWLSENFIWASHPKSFMLNAFPLQKASHCWKYLKPQSEKQSKSSQFVLHHAICKTSSVLPLKTIISLIESMRQCLRFIQKLQDCETGKNAKMKYIYSLSEYWCIFWWPSLRWRLKRADENSWVLTLNPAFQKSHS